MIETRLMQYFLAVAKEQNITKAAKVLHITQPTLSRQMAMLEKEIGATLFIKGSRPLSLTNEGCLLYTSADLLPSSWLFPAASSLLLSSPDQSSHPFWQKAASMQSD